MGTIIRSITILLAGMMISGQYSCTKDDKQITPPATTTSGTLEPSEQKLLKLVNDVRTAGCNCGNEYFPPVGSVAWDSRLEDAARNHSVYMNNNNTLSHTGANNSDPGQRIEAAGYNWMTYGENVASGYPDEESVIKGWLNSPGHCKNIMNGKFVHMGIARSGDYWTQAFGAPRQ
jgi:uncharacterized protein YkwD